jgi:hypothetical protein
MLLERTANGWYSADLVELFIDVHRTSFAPVRKDECPVATPALAAAQYPAGITADMP